MKYLILCCALLSVQALFAASTNGDQSTKSYPARGVIEKIAPDLRQATIHHQTIPGYMMEMTMDFNLKNTNEISGISPNDEITFTLVVGQNDEWIENIHRVGRAVETTTNKIIRTSGLSGVMMMPELKSGDLLPDYVLKAEGGSQIHVSDYRGRALAFTFFYTRCPLPDYCPRMNNNFAQARKILLADASAPTNWQFLSISFDPEFDTPDVLKNYADVYRGDDASRWSFASAPTNVLADAAGHLDLMVMRQGNGLSHNLRTVVLDPQGRIYRQFDGNQWTPQELASVMRAAMQEQTGIAQ
jgi:protein SCO1/2